MKNKENSLLPAWSLVLFFLIILSVLLVLFPGEKLLNSFNYNPTDRASVQYLKEFIARKLDDELKIKLAHKLFFLGNLSEAEAVLYPLLKNSEWSNESQFLTIKIQYRQFFNQPEKAEKKVNKLQVIKSINTFYPNLLDIDSLDLLAQWSHELSEPALAADIYQKIGELLEEKQATQDKVSNDTLWSLIGIQNVYAEKSDKNAEYYAIKQLQALLAANLLDNALNKAKIFVIKFNNSEKILEQAIQVAALAGKPLQYRDWGRLLLANFGINNKKIQQQIAREIAADDAQNSLQWADSLLEHTKITYPSLLAYGTNLASSLGKKEVFRRFSIKQLAQNPDNPDLLAQLVQSELALGDLYSALQHASRRIILDPENVEAHKQLAKVAQWSGAPYTSMKQLTWLYQKTANETYIKSAIKTGKALFQYARVAKQYEILSDHRILTNSELKDLYEVLNQTGFIGSGKREIKKYIKKWSNHGQAWNYLALINELNGHYSEAFQALEMAEQKLGKTEIMSINKIEMLIKASDYDTAWQKLSKDAEESQPEDSSFWKFYTQIAWFLGYEQETEKAYYHLLNHGDIEQEEVDRLLDLLNIKGSGDSRQIELLISAWKKFKQPNYLLDAIDLSEKLKISEQTTELITITDDNRFLFENNARYWTNKARLEGRKKNHLLAKSFLLKALALDPHLMSARIALLWHVIEYNSDSSLRVMLASAGSITKNHTELWEAIAAGYLRLGEPVHALPWYERLVQQKPNDYLLLLSYAETLNDAGKRSKAKKIKRFVMTSVRPELVANLSNMKPELAEFKRRYGNAIHDAFGANITEKWFKKVQQTNKQVKQVLFDEYRITWLLAENRIESARKYLLKSLHKRIAMPIWQNIAIAIYDNDIGAINKLLEEPDKLSTTNKIAGLRMVGREQDALIATRGYLNNDQKKQGTLALRRQAADLGIRNPNGFAVTGKINNISQLDVWDINSEAAFTYGVNSYWLNYKYLNFSSNSPNLIIQPKHKQENNLAIKWRHRGLRNEFWLQGQAVLRAGHNLYGAQIGLKHKIVEGWSASIEAAYNELSEESAAFRLMGARDRITLRLNGGLSKRDFFSLNVHGKNYKTRYGAHLGKGFETDFSIGYRVNFADPAIDINIQGVLSKSDLTSQLPAEMQAIVGSNSGIQNILSDSYKEIGLNLKVYNGESRPFGFVEKSFHYYLNTGVFFSEPWAGTGILVEAGIGTRLFSHDDLSLIGRYVDSQGGVNTAATQSIELRYSLILDEVFQKLLFNSH